MAREIWKDVPGYEGIYQASNRGRIRSRPRRDVLGRRVAARILKDGVNADGYRTVVLCNGSRVTRGVHALVAETFHGPRPEGLLVLHNDGNKLNCSASNLRYGTLSDNQIDRMLHGGRCVKPCQVQGIRQGIAEGANRSALARQFGVSRTTVFDIEYGRRYAYV